MTLLDKLDALIAETEKATPGPWKYVSNFGLTTNDSATLHLLSDADCEFIASARTGYPAALRALKVAVEILLDVDVCAKCFPSGEYDCPEIVCYGCKAIAEIEKEFKCTNTN